MTASTDTQSTGPEINIFLVAHTNVGKTTLLRTLLGKDVGEIDDAPDVTQNSLAHELIADPELGVLRLWDTPGFSDSFRLAKRLAQPHRWIAWGVREIWDRVFNRKLWQYQRLTLDLRARASVILYPVNLQERPSEAVYVAPEMEVLRWVGKPVLVVLNQGGGLHAQAVESPRALEWRTHLSGFPAVLGVISLDAYTRCWVQELSLYDKIGQVLAEDMREAYLKTVSVLIRTYADRLEESVTSIADYLLQLANDKVELESGWFDGMNDIWGRLRKSISWGNSDALTLLESSIKGLAQRYAENSKAVTDKLIAINRLDGTSTVEIINFANAKLVTDKPVDSGSAAVLGGVMSGVLSGLAADLVSGGLTLGIGALIGGVLGATGSAALAKGYNVSTNKNKKVVGWSPDAMTEAFEKSLMLYLAVAHFGRGQGEWRAREAPESWRASINFTVNLHNDRLRSLWLSVGVQSTAAAQTECSSLVRRAIRDVLMDIHPEFNFAYLRKPSLVKQLR